MVFGRDTDDFCAVRWGFGWCAVEYRFRTTCGHFGARCWFTDTGPVSSQDVDGKRPLRGFPDGFQRVVRADAADSSSGKERSAVGTQRRIHQLSGEHLFTVRSAIYDLLKRSGGRMGVVFPCPTSLDREWRSRMILRGRLGERFGHAAFLAEARATARSIHPGIVPGL